MFKTSSSADGFRISAPDYIASPVPYPPGKPIEEREYGLVASIKLASNENPPLGPSHMAFAALDNDDFLEQTRKVVAEGVVFLYWEIVRLGLNTVSARAIFFLIEVPTDAGTVYEAMLHQGVIIRPLNACGMTSTIRMNVGLPEENERFVRILGHILGELQGLN